jgi:glycosyltransferase involved in cell wall biosynthesis
MIAILHGYLLEGSGSNLWTRSVIQSICSSGETVHLICQENHPELYDFICEGILYHPNGNKETVLKRDPVYPGRCILHKPKLGNTLPVYVSDKYEEFSDPQPMINLGDAEIENYLQINIEVLTRVVDENQVKVIHANHAVLMSVVAQRVAQKRKIPYAIMPHGSAIEYAVKKDRRFYKYAEQAFGEAQRIYVIGNEIRNRVKAIFTAIPEIESKMLELNLGVNTSLFTPVTVKDRKAKMNELYGLLKDVKRGKTNLQSQHMQNELKADISEKELLKIVNDSASYNAKLTDDDIEEKLQMIDWDNEKIILYVGRLIANKGLHSIIAALPEILDTERNTRLIVVGHGPQREPLEALIWALQNGHRDLVLNIVKWGRELESDGEKSLEEVQFYFDHLIKTDELDNYFFKAQKNINKNTVLFTGYLTHRELCYLFPACDVAIFPSVVAEAGPLVFLEAMASGCFPIGTYFAGMAASIDSVSQAVPGEIADSMKISPRADQTVLDIVLKVKKALYVDIKYKERLRDIAIEKYDWKNISNRLVSDLYQIDNI